MASVTLPTPTLQFGSQYTGPKTGAASALLLPASEATAPSGGGFNFPNNGSIILRIVTGTVIGTISFILQGTVEGIAPAAVVPLVGGGALAVSTAYIFGPFDTAEWNDVNGLFQANWTGNTGGTAGLYQLPGSRYGQ